MSRAQFFPVILKLLVCDEITGDIGNNTDLGLILKLTKLESLWEGQVIYIFSKFLW